MDSYTDLNAKTIDQWIAEGWAWGIPVSHEAYLAAQKGAPQIRLTPNRSIPLHWLGDLRGKKVLGLAAGGGQQMPLLAAIGAQCTVMDYSAKQIESDQKVAAREGYKIEAIRGDMTQRFPFDDETFDLIVHPVSNCYVRDVFHVFRECWRVLKKGGCLLSGLPNEINYMVNDDETAIANRMPFDPLVNEDQRRMLEANQCGMQFSHSLEEQLGGQLQAGFRLLELYEDTNASGRLHDLHINAYLATRSIKE